MEWGDFISKFVSWKKFVRLSEKGYVDKAVVVRRMQDGSLERQELTVQTVSACGRLLAPGEAAGLCSTCRLVECQEHFVHCSICRRPFCVIHASQYQIGAKVISLCLDCCARDTWLVPLLSMRNTHEQRRLAE